MTNLKRENIAGEGWKTVPDEGDTGPQGPDGPAGATGPAGPAPSGTGFVHVTSGVLDTPVAFSRLNLTGASQIVAPPNESPSGWTDISWSAVASQEGTGLTLDEDDDTKINVADAGTYLVRASVGMQAPDSTQSIIVGSVDSSDPVAGLLQPQDCPLGANARGPNPTQATQPAFVFVATVGGNSWLRFRVSTDATVDATASAPILDIVRIM